MWVFLVIFFTLHHIMNRYLRKQRGKQRIKIKLNFRLGIDLSNPSAHSIVVAHKQVTDTWQMLSLCTYIHVWCGGYICAKHLHV